MSTTSTNKGWQVTMAGLGINLALGVLYAWSIFKGAIKASIEKGGPDAFNWSLSSINDPYAICCLVFAFAMVAAGKCQDKIGPARPALIGGLFVGAGFTLMSFSNSYAAWVVGFGVLAGTGFGFGYGAATPPALKWFSSTKTGVIAGIVVAGSVGGSRPSVHVEIQWIISKWRVCQNRTLIIGASASHTCQTESDGNKQPAG